MNSIIQIRIDKETKNQAKKIFEKMGLDISSGVKVYLKQVVLSRSIPFELRTENGFTPDQEKRMIKEAKWALKNGKRHTSIDQLFRDLKR